MNFFFCFLLAKVQAYPYVAAGFNKVNLEIRTQTFGDRIV
jgi:hypothetical protein